MEHSKQEAKPVERPWEDGAFTFQVARCDGTVTDHTIDLLVFKLAMEEVELNCGIFPDENGDMKPTPSFLVALAQRFGQLGFECTATIAYMLWAAVHGKMRELKKRQQQTLESPSGTT